MKGMFVQTVLGMLLMSSHAWSAEKRCEFPTATYEGEGTWENFADEKNTYQVKTEFNGSTIETVYQFGENQTLKVHMKIAERNGACVLSVSADEKRDGGQGYCSATGCTYRVKGDDLRLEEHFMLQNNLLYRVGFRVQPSRGDNGILSWAEKLPKK